MNKNTIWNAFVVEGFRFACDRFIMGPKQNLILCYGTVIACFDQQFEFTGESNSKNLNLVLLDK